MRKIPGTIAVLLWLLLAQQGWAATYTFPGGALPNGCSRSGSVINCAFYLTLANNDTVIVTSPTTLNINGGAGFNGANVNWGGAASNLTINLNGGLNVGNNAEVSANITAPNMYATGNNIKLNGVLNIAGQLSVGGVNAQATIQVTASSVFTGNNANITGNFNVSGQFNPGSNNTLVGNVSAGSVSTGSGANITGNYDVAGSFGLGSSSVMNGDVEADTINIGQNSTINGQLDASNNVNLSQGATVTGDVNAGNNLNANNSGIQLNGNVTVGNNANIGTGMQITGTVDATGDVNMNSNAYIDGDVNGNNINIGNGSVIDGNVDSGGQVSNQGTINGNVNSDGPVYTGNGTVTGYVNAPNEDEVANTGNVGGPVCDQNSNEGPCSGGGGGVQFYRIINSGPVLTCEATSVEIRACADAGCTTGVPLNGGITLQAAGSQNFSATGSFSSSDTATVSLAVTTAGSYTLNLTAVPEAAVDPVQCVGPGGCTLTAVDAALRWSPLGPETAGVPFSAQLEAIRTDSQTGACQAAVQGVTQIEVGVNCLDPASCVNGGTLFEVAATAISELPTTTTVPVSFNASGVATLELDYQDVGRVSLYAEADIGSSQISGTSEEFVVRPYEIGVEVTNPVLYSSQIFARAGDELGVVLTALSATGQVTPNFGNEIAPETLTLSTVGNTVTPATPPGVNGSLQIVDAFSQSGDGEFSSADVRYMEAGTVTFTAHVTDNDYLGTGSVSSVSEPLGRFLPWQFQIDYSSVQAACLAGTPEFSYLEQAFPVTFDVSARNRDGAVTQNYPDQGVGAEAVMQARDMINNDSLSTRITPAWTQPVWVAGVAEVDTELALSRLADDEPDGPFEQVQLAVLIDEQFVPMAVVDFDDATAIGVEQRLVFGRLVLTDTFGPEFTDLPITLQVHFWEGERFRVHTADSCTLTDPDLLEIMENLAELHTESSGLGGNVISGQAPPGSLFWTSSNEPGNIRFTYPAPDWLKFGDDNNGDPSAYAVFGNYGGHDRVIHWRLKTAD